jgi:hypothetical protein
VISFRRNGTLVDLQNRSSIRVPEERHILYPLNKLFMYKYVKQQIPRISNTQLPKIGELEPSNSQPSTNNLPHAFANIHHCHIF